MLRRVALFLGAAILVMIALAFWPDRSSSPHPTNPVPIRLGMGPELEGVPVDRVLGLHQGKRHRDVKKLAKPFAGKTLRIVGQVRERRRTSPMMAYVFLQGSQGGDSGVSLMFRSEFEPDLSIVPASGAIRASCVFRGEIRPDSVLFEDCRLTP